MSEENINYDCEYIKSLSDEYLHNELSEQDKKTVESHLLECDDCKSFYDEEKKLTDIIKSSEYTTDDSFSNLVMEKIVEEKITIQKPSRKRPVPFGLISAAVIILMIFLANPDMFSITDNAYIQPNEVAGESESAYMLQSADMAANFDIGGADNDSASGGEYRDEFNEEAEYDDAIPSPVIAPSPDPAMFDLPIAEAELSVIPEEQINIESGGVMMRDIPVPTGPFSARSVVLIICVSVDADIRDKLIKDIFEQIPAAEISEHDTNIIYMPKETQNTVIDILNRNFVQYEFRDGNLNNKDIAVFFY